VENWSRVGVQETVQKGQKTNVCGNWGVKSTAWERRVRIPDRK